jgi:hypothetical protein
VVEASKAEKNPALHAVHCEVALAEKVPGKHLLHVPLAVKKPAGHCMQSVALDDPVMLWEYPDGQALHAVCPVHAL